MAYVRMHSGAAVQKSVIESGDVIAQCECGGDIVAMDDDEDGDWVACCDGCAEWSNWLQDDGRVVKDVDTQKLAQVIDINERKLACRR